MEEIRFSITYITTYITEYVKSKQNMIELSQGKYC